MMKLCEAAVTGVPQVSVFGMLPNCHEAFLGEAAGALCDYTRWKVHFHESLSDVHPDVKLFTTAQLLFGLNAKSL